MCFATSFYMYSPYFFLFQFFLKATQLEQMSSDYQLIIEQQDIIKNTLDKKQEVCITHIQSNLSNTDTEGTEQSVRIGEVSIL